MENKQRLIDKDYIPGLYGWKFIAIYLLMADHLCISSGIARSAYTMPFTDGLTGVFAFFIISGYLVTRAALKEKSALGRLSLKRFFFRRALRVIPAYYVFLILMGILYPITYVTLRSILSGLAFTVNYTSDPYIVINVGHIWACCVEEHFYLIWIPLLAVFKKNRLWPFLVAFIVIPTVLRFLSFPDTPYISLWWTTYSLSYLHFPAMALGAGLAVFEGRDRFERIILSAKKRYAHIWAAVFILVLSPQLKHHYQLAYFWDYQPLLISLALTVLLAVYLRSEENILTRVLDCSLIRRIGIMYYSLYLWQQPFTFTFFKEHLNSLGIFESVLFTLLCSGASYIFIEKPCSRRRNTLDHNHGDTFTS